MNTLHVTTAVLSLAKFMLPLNFICLFLASISLIAPSLGVSELIGVSRILLIAILLLNLYNIYLFLRIRFDQQVLRHWSQQPVDESALRAFDESLKPLGLNKKRHFQDLPQRLQGCMRFFLRYTLLSLVSPLLFVFC